MPAGSLPQAAVLPATDGADRMATSALGRWTLAVLVALAAHGFAAVLLLPKDSPASAPQAPEAAIMIDLPPDEALPPAETVDSVAAAAAEEVTPQESDAATPPSEQAETAEPMESIEMPDPAQAAEMSEVADSTPVETTESIDAAKEATPVEPEPLQADEVPDEAPNEALAEAVPADVPPDAKELEAPAELAESQMVETAEVATVVPAPRPLRPNAPPKPRTARAETPKKPAAPPRPSPSAQPPASSTSLAGNKASGAGAPDKSALSRFISSVRADIMKQRRALTGAGGGKVAVVSFTIGTSGTLSGIRITRSSGEPALDAAAVAMVQRASPVPPIPADVGRPSLAASLPVRLD